MRTAAVVLAATVACPGVSVHAQAPSSAQFDRAVAYAAGTDGQAVLVMHRGRIVYERYMNGGSAAKAMLLASGSKSFVGVAAIAAVADGMLTLDQPVADLLPEWKQDPRKSRVTVRQLLSLESGVDAGTAGTGCGGPGSTWMDAVQAASQVEPGTRFRYGPFPFITMGAAIERAAKNERFEVYLQRRIFAPIGMTVTWPLKCGDGRPQLAGGASTTARDWATFGEMIRRGGVHGSTRILPDSLVAQLFRPSTVNSAYGLAWWLRDAAFQRNPARGAPRRAGSDAPARNTSWLPQDLVMAAGAGKQRLYLIPSHELVVVRTGAVRGGKAFNDDEFLAALLR